MRTELTRKPNEFRFLAITVTVDVNIVIAGGLCHSSMIPFQDAFTSSTLNVVLADTSITFPYDHDTQGDDWLSALQSTDADRSVAFFGECPRNRGMFDSPSVH